MNVFYFQYMRYSDNGKKSEIFIQKCSHTCSDIEDYVIIIKNIYKYIKNAI